MTPPSSLLTPLTFCRLCGMPIYRVREDTTGKTVALDWLPVPEGSYLINRLTDSCQWVPAEERQAGRLIYQRNHAETCEHVPSQPTAQAGDREGSAPAAPPGPPTPDAQPEAVPPAPAPPVPPPPRPPSPKLAPKHSQAATGTGPRARRAVNCTDQSHRAFGWWHLIEGEWVCSAAVHDMPSTDE